MRRDWLTLFYSLAFLLILGMGTIFLPAGAQTITGSANFDPDRYFFGGIGFGVANVTATIRFESGQNAHVSDINTSTILLEGSLPPLATYLVPGGLNADFDAIMVENIILAKIAHMGLPPPPRKILLTITGNLINTAGGTPFSVTGPIRINVVSTPPPP